KYLAFHLQILLVHGLARLCAGVVPVHNSVNDAQGRRPDAQPESHCDFNAAKAHHHARLLL
ncbi:MAG: hypothetical protein KKD85_00125, partial [Proteobacteria bacterium]|nr:hypothetical protein [Pseudomonadota bacterium]